MKAKRAFLISSVLLFFGSLFAYTQNKSGILLSGGAGTLDNEFVSPMTAGQIGRSFDLEYNYDLHLGYRYRLRQNDWLFWDLDALFGIKSFRKGILTGYGSNYVTCADGDRHLNYYLALSPSANAFLYKGLYAGIGIEPTWYLYRAGDDGMGFDLPAAVKLGYDFGRFSIEGAFKMGLIRHAETNLLEKNRRKEFQLSLFIPLW